MRIWTCSLVVVACASCGGPDFAHESPQAQVGPPPVQGPATEPSGPAPPATALPPPPVAADAPAGEDAARDRELATFAEPFIEAYQNVGARFSMDGKRVFFRSNRDGNWQLYAGEVAKPDAAPKRLTQTSERIVAAEPTADGKSVVVLSDRGADEQFSIFLIDAESGNSTELTPGERLQRDVPLLPDGSAGLMVYSARALSEKTTRIYAQAPAAGSQPKLVLTDPSPGGLVHVSVDGKRALLRRVVSPSESSLAVVDLAAASVKHLYPPAGKAVVVEAAQFSNDGSQVYVATDGGGQDALVLALDAQTGDEKARYVEAQPKTASLRSLVVSPKGGRIAVGVDAGNRSEVRVLDAKTLKSAGAVKLPLGSGGLGDFSKDDKRFTVTWSTSNAPADVFAVDAQGGRVVPLRKDARATLASLPAMEASIVEVPSFDGGKVPVNLYLPQGKKAQAERRPVIVSVHGGPAASSTVGWNAFNRFCVARGFAVVEPNIRGSTGFGRAYEMADNGPKRLDALKDLQKVAEWAGAQPWADPQKLVVFGGSYGGYMVLMALTRQAEIWRAGVDLVGPSNWRSFMASTSGLIREVLSKEFGSMERDAAFLDSISPLADAPKIADPLFVYQGQNDPRVPRPESDQIVRILRERKVPVEYMVAADEGHSIDRRATKVALYSRMMRFLERQGIAPAQAPAAAPKPAAQPDAAKPAGADAAAKPTAPAAAGATAPAAGKMKPIAPKKAPAAPTASPASK